MFNSANRLLTSYFTVELADEVYNALDFLKQIEYPDLEVILNEVLITDTETFEDPVPKAQALYNHLTLIYKDLLAEREIRESETITDLDRFAIVKGLFEIEWYEDSQAIRDLIGDSEDAVETLAELLFETSSIDISVTTMSIFDVSRSLIDKIGEIHTQRIDEELNLVETDNKVVGTMLKSLRRLNEAQEITSHPMINAIDAGLKLGLLYNTYISLYTTLYSSDRYDDIAVGLVISALISSDKREEYSTAWKNVVNDFNDLNKTSKVSNLVNELLIKYERVRDA